MIEKQRELERTRAELSAKARLLGAGRRSGWRVRATLTGNGSANVTMTYQIGPARWIPSYDIQLAPETGKVSISFSGFVSQETGEDWNNAALTLSTAVPSTSTVFPKLATWKIGERDRFIPTPVALDERVRAAPMAATPPPGERDWESLRNRLRSYGGPANTDHRAAPETTPGDESEDRPSQNEPIEEPSKQRRTSEEIVVTGSRLKARSSRSDASAPKPVALAGPPPSAAPAATAESLDGASRDVSRPRGGLSNALDPGRSSASSLEPPPGYQPPTYDPDLPASQAGGYDLSYSAQRPETLQSGKGARRVALFRETWPVSIERRFFPALAHDAFLVASLKSPAKQLLPGGKANLFVGADPAGTAQLKRVAPGESFTLPLGLDRAIHPIRNVQQVLVEKGFIVGKQEMTEYVVIDELTNPYPIPIQIRVFDQWPVTEDKDVQIALTQTQPYALQDRVKGSLEWDLTVPAGAKQVVSFHYTLRKPKGWRMHQDQ